MINDFAIFILTHGRPNSQKTLNYLLNNGYEGKWFLILDDQDKTIQEYIDNFNYENIYVFDKNHYINSVENGTNKPQDKCILYAKCAAEDIARDLGLKSFILADDDIASMSFRYVDGEHLKSVSINNIDDVIKAYNKCLLDSDIVAMGFGFTQFFMQGVKSFSNDAFQKYRVPYNFVFRNAKYKVNWLSNYCEDILTATENIVRDGKFWASTPFVHIYNPPLGTNEGGMHETYKNMSDCKRCMFNVVFRPTSFKIKPFKNKLVIYTIRNNAFPKLISDKYKRR